MDTNEKNKLEAILAVAETNQFDTKDVIVHTIESLDLYVKNLINEQIPTWEKSREIDIKKNASIRSFFWMGNSRID